MIVGVLSLEVPTAREAERFVPGVPLLSVYVPVPAPWATVTDHAFAPETTAAVKARVLPACVVEEMPVPVNV